MVRASARALAAPSSLKTTVGWVRALAQGLRTRPCMRDGRHQVLADGPSTLMSRGKSQLTGDLSAAARSRTVTRRHASVAPPSRRRRPLARSRRPAFSSALSDYLTPRTRTRAPKPSGRGGCRFQNRNVRFHDVPVTFQKPEVRKQGGSVRQQKPLSAGFQPPSTPPPQGGDRRQGLGSFRHGPAGFPPQCTRTASPLGRQAARSCYVAKGCEKMPPGLAAQPHALVTSRTGVGRPLQRLATSQDGIGGAPRGPDALQSLMGCPITGRRRRTARRGRATSVGWQAVHGHGRPEPAHPGTIHSDCTARHPSSERSERAVPCPASASERAAPRTATRE